MSKENSSSGRRGYAAALQRKQDAANNNQDGARLPRVAALASKSHSLLRRSGVYTRPLSSLRNVPSQAPRPPSTSSHRVGCKPATHSTRTLVPLLDVHTAGEASTPATSTAPAPIASATPSMLSSIIGDPGLDDEEQQLQAELATYDQRLEQLHQHQSQRRTATPTPAASFAAQRLSPAGTTSPAPITGVPEQVATPQQLQASGQQQQEKQFAQQHQQQQVSQQDRLLEREREQPEPEALAVPPSELSIVRSVTTATGTGCKDIIAPHAAAAVPAGACWTSRGHRVLLLESSCILQLWGRRNADIKLQIIFADAASVPRVVRLMHAPTATAAFELLGDIHLQPESLQKLRHLFRLGSGLEVQRFLRITLLGHMSDANSGAHRVKYMLLTSGLGPQRAQSAQSTGHAGSAVPATASAQPSVHSRSNEEAAVDSAASTTPPPLATEQAAVAENPQPAVPPPQMSDVRPDSQSAVSNVVPPTHEPFVPPASPAEPACPDQLGSSGPALAFASTQPAKSPAANAAKQQQEQVRPGSPKSGLPLSWRGLDNSQVGETVWGQLEGVAAEVDFQALQAEFAGQAESSPQEADNGSHGAAPVMLLPMQRSQHISAFLSELSLTPDQARQAVLKLFDTGNHATAADLTAEQVEHLRTCLPSPEEKQLLRGYCGQPEALVAPEQFMLGLVHLPGLEQALDAWPFTSQFASRAQEVEAAATLLVCACQEVRHSDMLRTLLKVALLAGNFLNAGNHNGAAAGFQIDALLKLKEVRSTRARSRTLLHFVAREVARQHPGAARLGAALPSAESAAQLNLEQACGQLRELAAGVRGVARLVAAAQEAAGTTGGRQSTCLAHMTSFMAEALVRLGAAEEKMQEAEHAFRQLGDFINGQRSTLAQPSAFFGVLHTFAAELDAAHEENSAVDAAAGCSSKGSQGESQRRLNESRSAPASGGSPATSVISVEALHRRYPISQENSSPQGVGRALREKPVSTPPERRQHSPAACMSKAAIAGIGGIRRSLQPGGSLSSAADGHAGAANAAQASVAVGQPAVGRMSTPVASLLAESARLISSLEASPDDVAGGHAAGDPCLFEQSVPATPVSPEAAGGPEAEADAAYSTPRGPVRLHWQGEQPAAVQHQHRSIPGELPNQKVQPKGQQQQWQGRYTATVSSDQEVPAPAVAPAALVEAALQAQRGSQQLGLSQLRQRSLQQLSPTSTPLSSLGRQSSRGSVHSSLSNGSPPGSSMRFRSSHLRRSTSPLGMPGIAPVLGAAVAEAEAGNRACDGAAAAAGPIRVAALQHLAPLISLDDDLTAAPALLPSEVPGCFPPDDRYQQQGSLQHDTHCCPSPEEEDFEAAQGKEGQQPLGHGIVPLHSRASSCDLTFYAPFSMDRAGHDAFAQHGGQQAELRLSASFTCGNLPATAWGPLAAQQQQLAQQGHSHALLHASMDDLALPRGPVPSAAADKKRVSFSVPNSPRSSIDALGAQGASRPPHPVNLQGVADRLQMHQHMSHQVDIRASGRFEHAEDRHHQPLPQRQFQAQQHAEPASHQQAQRQVSPVLEGLLNSVPTPFAQPAPAAAPIGVTGPAVGSVAGAPPAASCSLLDVDDLADLADYSSDHEAEWEQLLALEQQEVEWQRQQEAARDAREQALLQQPVVCSPPPPHQQQHQQWGDQWALPQQQRLQKEPGQGEGQWPDGYDTGQCPLPSPITSATSNLDAAVARLLACAGNTTAGPLAQGAALIDARDAVPLASGTAAVSSHSALLEPILLGHLRPMGEGVRASRAMAQQVPAAALRASVEGARPTLRGSGSALAALMSAGAKAWAEAAKPAGAPPHASGGNTGSVGCAPTSRPDRPWGLKRMLGKHN